MSTKLNLRIHSVKCVDETGGSFAEKFGNDEIDLGGFTVDNENKTVKISSSRIYADFDDGDSKKFNPPKVFTSFKLGLNFTNTQKYAVGFVLAESDSGNANSILQKIVDYVMEEVKKRIKAATDARSAMHASENGVATAKAVILPVGFIWAMVQPYVVSYVTNKIKSWVGDDIFPLKDAVVTLRNANHTWNGKKTSPVEMIEFRGHDGVYQLFYDWQLV